MKKLVAVAFVFAAAIVPFVGSTPAQAKPDVPGTCEILNNTACDGNVCAHGNDLIICEISWQ